MMRVGISGLMRVETWALMRAGTLSKTLTRVGTLSMTLMRVWTLLMTKFGKLPLMRDGRVGDRVIDEGWGQGH